MSAAPHPRFSQPREIFDDLVWIDDPTPRDGTLNMAIDETLLTGFAAAGAVARPILRVYRWSGPWVSIGYFEPLGSAQRAFPRRKLVRRWTGGGIVPHGEDLTYSLLVPRTCLPGHWRGTAAYNDIHALVAAALRVVGLDHVVLGGEVSAVRQGASHECFNNPVKHDVMLSGHKVAGAAQRKTRDGLLHQGSIQADGGSGVGHPRFAPGTALHADVCAGLPDALARQIEPRQLTVHELESAHSLAVVRYGVPGWLEKY